MAHVILGGNGNRRRHNIPRLFRDRMNPLEEMNDHELIKKYRLDRDAILEICAQAQQHLLRPTSRSQSLQVSLQVLVALRYYATGSFQSVLADGHGISIHSVSRSIHAVSKALTRQVPRQIKLPTTHAELIRTKQVFHDKSGFPNVIGAVDGTYGPIMSPTEDEHLYVTRKGFHAINVLGICNGDNLFTNIVVCWPGSTHDAFIWNNCECVRMIEELDLHNTWILGDSAYPLRKYLLTPLPTTNTEAERRYNVAHKRTRCVVERTFGIWKMRFRCLHKFGGYMTYTPVKCAKIITAVAVLHNICVTRNLPFIDDNDDRDDDNYNDNNGDDNNGNDGGNNSNDDGRQTRNNLIRETFSR